MGIFDFLKTNKKKVAQADDQAASVIVQGPTYLRNQLQRVTRQVAGLPRFNPETQFVGKLITEADSRFRLKFFGQLSPGGLITDQGEAPMKVIAIGEASGQEILLFDKHYHGWAAFITGAFQDHRSMDRTPVLDFDVNSIMCFEIYLVAHYNPGTKSELIEENVDGIVEIANGKKLALQDAFDDAFDVIEIVGIDDNGKAYKILAEELA